VAQNIVRTHKKEICSRVMKFSAFYETRRFNMM